MLIEPAVLLSGVAQEFEVCEELGDNGVESVAEGVGFSVYYARRCWVAGQLRRYWRVGRQGWHQSRYRRG